MNKYMECIYAIHTSHSFKDVCKHLRRKRVSYEEFNAPDTLLGISVPTGGAGEIIIKTNDQRTYSVECIDSGRYSVTTEKSAMRYGGVR